MSSLCSVSVLGELSPDHVSQTLCFLCHHSGRLPAPYFLFPTSYFYFHFQSLFPTPFSTSLLCISRLRQTCLVCKGNARSLPHTPPPPPPLRLRIVLKGKLRKTENFRILSRKVRILKSPSCLRLNLK